jgi:quercetin dioxygenase-like cupin family protein
MNVTTTSTTDPYVGLESEARWYGDGLLEFLVPAAATHGALSVFRATLPEGSGPPRHIHTHEDEVMLVLEGEVLFEADGERVIAGPGASVYLPRGGTHAFRVQSTRAVILGIVTPGAFETFFRELSEPAGDRVLPSPDAPPLDIAKLMDVLGRLGVEAVGPPLTAEDA